MQLARLVLVTSIAIVACAKPPPMATYPGLDGTLTESQRGNYELCETGQTQHRPNAETQFYACNVFADNYRMGSAGWFRYKGLACQLDNQSACRDLVFVSANDLTDGTYGSFYGDRPTPELRRSALQHGLHACEIGPSRDAWASREVNGETCLFSALLLLHFDPAQQEQATALVTRGCEHYGAGSACGMQKKLVGRIDRERVAAVQQRNEADAEHRLDRETNAVIERQQREAEAEALDGAASDRFHARARETVRQGQQDFEAQLGNQRRALERPQTSAQPTGADATPGQSPARSGATGQEQAAAGEEPCPAGSVRHVDSGKCLRMLTAYAYFRCEHTDRAGVQYIVYADTQPTPYREDDIYLLPAKEVQDRAERAITAYLRTHAKGFAGSSSQPRDSTHLEPQQQVKRRLSSAMTEDHARLAQARESNGAHVVLVDPQSGRVLRDLVVRARTSTQKPAPGAQRAE